jgi:hypothetical protein
MLILGAVLAVAQTAAPAGASPRARSAAAAQCSAVSVRSAEDPRARAVFSATKILDLRLSVMLRGLSPATVAQSVRFRVLTPKGNLYQELKALVSTDPIPGQNGQGPHADTRLPVAGTSIMTSSLYGQWKVEPHLDGDLTSCGAATTFTITQ